jgi:acyl carrier protein
LNLIYTSLVSLEKRNIAFGEGEFLKMLSSAGVILSHPEIEPTLDFLPSKSIKLEDLLIDSFTFIQIAIQLEDQFDLSLSPDKLQATKTLKGLFELLEKNIDASR